MDWSVNHLLLIAGAPLLFGLFSVWFLGQFGRDKHIEERLKKIKNNAFKTGYFRPKHEDSYLYGTQLKSLQEKLASTFLGFTREKAAAYRLRFEQAGLPETYAPVITILCNLLFLVLGGLIYIALVSLTSLADQDIIFKFVLLLISIFVSLRFLEYLIDYKIRKRYKRIKKTLSFSVDMLSICTKSSLSLDKSFEKISEEMAIYNKDLSKEFMRISLELNIIPDRVQALRNFTNRVDIPMTHLLVSGLIHALEQGVSLSHTLTNLSQEFSKHRIIEIEEKAARLPVLLTLPLALFCLPAMLLILLGPVFASLMGVSVFN